MENNTLFLLEPNFRDTGKGPYFCPGCAQIIGLMEFYPELKKHLEIRYLGFPRPRPALVELLGAENQSCPVLVLTMCPNDLPADLKVQNACGRFYVEGANDISEYLAHVFGTGIPH